MPPVKSRRRLRGGGAGQSDRDLTDELKVPGDVAGALQRAGAGKTSTVTLDTITFVTGLRHIDLCALIRIMRCWGGMILPCYSGGNLAFRVSAIGQGIEHPPAAHMDAKEGMAEEKLGSTDDSTLVEIVRRMPLNADVKYECNDTTVTVTLTPKSDADCYMPLKELIECMRVTAHHTQRFRLKAKSVEIIFMRYSEGSLSLYQMLEKQHLANSKGSLYGVDLSAF